jgi:hypothetical protein
MVSLLYCAVLCCNVCVTHMCMYLQEAACEGDSRQAEQPVGQPDPGLLQTQQGVWYAGGCVCVCGEGGLGKGWWSALFATT